MALQDSDFRGGDRVIVAPPGLGVVKAGEIWAPGDGQVWRIADGQVEFGVLEESLDFAYQPASVLRRVSEPPATVSLRRMLYVAGAWDARFHAGRTVEVAEGDELTTVLDSLHLLESIRQALGRLVGSALKFAGAMRSRVELDLEDDERWVWSVVGEMIRRQSPDRPGMAAFGELLRELREFAIGDEERRASVVGDPRVASLVIAGGLPRVAASMGGEFK